MSYTCEWCEKQHNPTESLLEFTDLCEDCWGELEGGDLHKCDKCSDLYEGVCPCTKEVQA